ncbi:DgyrCDS2546 [Dimorphilus gyrociliatus]|uniref:DgyrCDS2546 n=1 Tax=Dimorphilus gyrociliatus TaxID=2664684 RepID=A0A7I8VAV0_9ANNE|nr:DgyrCDS2546 [Dimorphilus gyrociliatus]
MEDSGISKGPISERDAKRAYIESNHIPEMFSSLLAALMIERPKDHFDYLDQKLEIIKQVGAYRVDWESFVYELHPHRQQHYLKNIQNEYTEKIKRLMEIWLTQHDYMKVFRLTEVDEDKEDIDS